MLAKIYYLLLKCGSNTIEQATNILGILNPNDE